MTVTMQALKSSKPAALIAQVRLSRQVPQRRAPKSFCQLQDVHIQSATDAGVACIQHCPDMVAFHITTSGAH
jgi:hypothetical protein